MFFQCLFLGKKEERPERLCKHCWCAERHSLHCVYEERRLGEHEGDAVAAWPDADVQGARLQLQPRRALGPATAQRRAAAVPAPPPPRHEQLQRGRHAHQTDDHHVPEYVSFY